MICTGCIHEAHPMGCTETILTHSTQGTIAANCPCVVQTVALPPAPEDRFRQIEISQKEILAILGLVSARTEYIVARYLDDHEEIRHLRADLDTLGADVVKLRNEAIAEITERISTLEATVEEIRALVQP